MVWENRERFKANSEASEFDDGWGYSHTTTELSVAAMKVAVYQGSSIYIINSSIYNSSFLFFIFLMVRSYFVLQIYENFTSQSMLSILSKKKNQIS